MISLVGQTNAPSAQNPEQLLTDIWPAAIWTTQQAMGSGSWIHHKPRTNYLWVVYQKLAGQQLLSQETRSPRGSGEFGDFMESFSVINSYEWKAQSFYR